MQSILALPTALWVRAASLDGRRSGKWRPLVLVLLALALWLLLAHGAWADTSTSSTSTSTSSGGSNPWGTAADPWGTSVGKLAGMLNGTVARGIGTIALFAAGGMLVFGGELNEFTKKICMVVVAVSVMVLGGGMIGTIFG
jgi:type IV secretory pathway VirB2 component (pilin)